MSIWTEIEERYPEASAAFDRDVLDAVAEPYFAVCDGVLYFTEAHCPLETGDTKRCNCRSWCSNTRRWVGWS